MKNEYAQLVMAGCPNIRDAICKFKEKQLWHNVNLTKAERKGKTPEEINLLRKERYLQQKKT